MVLSGAEQVNYIQNTMNPYMFSNFNAYKILQKSTILIQGELETCNSRKISRS